MKQLAVPLVAFALLPPALKGAAMFANGLALGMVWGERAADALQPCEDPRAEDAT